MVAQVCTGQIVAVAAREVSRFARNSQERQQLVEVCRVVEIHPRVYGDELGVTLTSTSEVENNAPSLAIARIR